VTSGSELGKAFVSISADTGDLEARLSEAEGQVQEFADSAEREANRSASGFGKIGDSAERSSKKARRSFGELSEELQTTASRQVGVITGFAGIAAAIGAVSIGSFKMGQAIRAAFDNARADKFRESVEGSADAIDDVAAGLRAVGQEQKPVADSFRAVLETARETNKAIADQAQAAVENRNIFEQLDDTLRFGLDGFFGSRSTILDEASAELERTGKAQARALRDARDAAARANDELLESAQRSIRDTLDPPTELQTQYREISEDIAQLEARLADASEGQKQRFRDTIASLKELQNELSRRTLVDIAQAEQERLAEIDREVQQRAQALRDEAETIRREALDPIQQQVLSAEDRIGELQELLQDNPASELKDAIVAAITAQSEKLDQIRRESKEQSEAQARAIVDGYERVTEQQLSRFGLDQVFSVLSIVAQNTRPD